MELHGAEIWGLAAVAGVSSNHGWNKGAWVQHAHPRPHA